MSGALAARLFACLVATTSVAPIASPVILWHVAGEARGTPAVDESTVYFATKRHQVVAFDRGSGRERWRQSTNEQGDETFGFNVLVAGSVVAVGDYNVIGFDRASGAMKWRFRPTDGHAPGPYLGATSGALLLMGSAGGRVHAVDAENGRAIWSATVASPNATVFQPITDGQRVFAGFTEFTAPNTGGMASLDVKTGTVLWKTSFPAPDDRSLSINWAGGPVLYHGVVLSGCGDGKLYAFDVSTGAISFALPRLSDLPPTNLVAPDRDMRPLAVSGDVLIAGSLTGVVAAYDLDSRKERWRFYSRWSGSTVFRIAADARTAYVPFFSGELIAIDVATGREAWRVGDWKAGFIWVPLVAKSRLYAAASSAGFYVFELTGGG